MAKMKRWSLVRLDGGNPVEVCWTFEHPAQDTPPTIASLPKQIQQMFEGNLVVMAWPKRLNTQDEMVLTFEVPGQENENSYPVEINETFAGIGFQYCLRIDTATHVRKMAPATAIRQLADLTTAIFGELKIESERTVVGIHESECIGANGYGGRGITGQGKRVYIELEVTEDCPLSNIDFWEPMIWHEAKHIQYALEGRFPTMWPFYRGGTAPLWALDDIVHFSIDGWLERNNKPTICYLTDDIGVSDMKSFRVSQLREDLRDSGFRVADDVIRSIADELWSRDTDIGEVYKIMMSLGLKIPGDTPLGEYLNEIK